MSPFYFTSYVLNMFRTLIYSSSGACYYSVELPHWSYCSWLLVGLEWYLCCRLKPATRIPLQPNVHERCDDIRCCVMQFWPPDDEHMCSKHLEALNKLIVKQNFCVSSWLFTETNMLRCTVSKTSKKKKYHKCLNGTELLPLLLLTLRMQTKPFQLAPSQKTWVTQN